MFTTYVDNLGDMAIIECEGRLVRSDAAFALREAVTSQHDARILVLDMSAVTAIEGGGLGMLVFLQRWAYDQDRRLKLFNLRPAVRDRVEQASSMHAFEIATLDELMALMARSDGPHTLAA